MSCFRRPCGRYRFERVAHIALALLIAAGHAHAADAVAPGAGVQLYQVPAGPLGRTLSSVASRAGLSLSFDPALTEGRTSAALSARLSARDALSRLLGGSGLELVGRPDGSYTLRKIAVPVTGDAATLPTVTVTAGTTPGARPAPYAGGQVARGGQLGILGNTDLMDAPFNITSYTAQVIEDQQAGTVAAVLQNDPSVRFTTSDGHIYENFNIRGFDINGEDLAFNGLYGLSPYGHAPTEFVDRIEVLKGPGALLSGMSPQGAVGGVINLIPKRAGATPLTRLTLDYTSEAQFGGHADISRRFGEDGQFGVRFNGAYRDGRTGVDGQSKERRLGAVALDYRGERLKVSLDAYDDVEEVDNGSAWMASFASGVIRPPKTGTNLLRGIYGKLENRAVLLQGEYALNDNLTAYAGIGSLRYRYSGYINGTRAAVRNNAGDYTGMTYHQRGGIDTVSGEAGLRGRFTTGPVGHQVVLSVTSLDYDSYRANPATSNRYESNIYHPVTPLLGDDPGHAPRTGKNTLSSVALADTLSFADDAVLLTLGARQQRVHTRSFDANTGARTAEYDESALTPALGLVVKPWGPSVSLYANYIEGLSQGGTVTDTTAANYGQMFAPYKTRQVEAGVKWDSGTFANTLSVFRISRPSMIKDVATNRYSDDGEQRNRGVEWTLFGQLTRDLSLLGGVAYTDSEITRAASSRLEGKSAYGIPEWKANLGAEWTLPWLRALTLSARAVYTGSQYVNSDNSQKIPSWTRFDLGARYATRMMGKPVTLRASVENVADKRYWAGSFGDGYVTQGAQRTVKLSTSIDF